MQPRSTVSITRSTGNVFADLGLANPEQELLKTRLHLPPGLRQTVKTQLAVR